VFVIFSYQAAYLSVLVTTPSMINVHGTSSHEGEQLTACSSMLDGKLNVKEELSISLTAIAVTEPTISALMPNILYKQFNSNQTRDACFTSPLKLFLDGFKCSSQP
jgi:hypothetical protein